jgi:hypothetical protein
MGVSDDQSTRLLVSGVLIAEFAISAEVREGEAGAAEASLQELVVMTAEEAGMFATGTARKPS